MPTIMSCQERERRRLVTSSHVTSDETDQSRRHKSKRERDKKLSMPLEECRRMYKNEVMMLWRELDDFRRSCKQQMDKQKKLMEGETLKSEHNSGDSKTQEAVPDLPEDFSHELKKLERNMSFLERNQGLLDQERQLVEKEESLARRHEKLRDYEKEVEEAEAMLSRRQSICDIRTREVETLNEDLLHMKHDIIDSAEDLERGDSSVDGAGTDQASQTSGGETGGGEAGSRDANFNSPEASAKARRHWTLARRHMLDKVTLLEGTVQRYRTQLASATATVTAKDLMIARLNKQITDLKEELQAKSYRLKQMETQLSITTEEKVRSERNFEMLLEELQNIDLSSTHQLHPSPQATPKHNGQAKLMRKQNSTFSFFGGGGGGGVGGGGNYGGSDGGDKNAHTNNFKEAFKRKILNVHSHNSSNTGTPRRKAVSNHAEGNGDARHELGNEEGNNEDSGVIEDDVDYGKKRVIHGYRDRNSSSSETGSKACIVM